MSFLNPLNPFTGLSDALSNGTTPLDQQVNNANQQAFQQDGFVVPPIPAADGTGLPSSKIPALNSGVPIRNIIHWFVPEVGIINMYINPQGISYNHKKLITPQMTKGGYIVQYWGEELTTININGHTGSSSVEGLNVLYEIYRSEQYTFDPLALTMAADSSIDGLNDTIDSALGNIGGLGTQVLNATQGLLGLDPASQNFLPTNVPSLASLALGIEMYHNGWVYRGFFTSMEVKESADRLGLFDYNIAFTATQRRGYRTNSLPWTRSATHGTSNNSPGGVPLSFANLLKGV